MKTGFSLFGVKNSRFLYNYRRNEGRFRLLDVCAAGFTLLELLIGITIFAILAGAVYTSFYLGIKVYKQEEKRDQLSQESVITVEEVAKKLRCAFLNPDDEKIKFSGTDKSIDFFCVNREGELENITYYLEPSADNNAFCLFQTTQKSLNSNSEIPPGIEIINTKIRLLRFSYFNGEENKWEEEWENDSKLPAQVKLVVEFGPVLADRPLLRLEKFITIPVTSKINFGEGEKL